MKKTEYQKIEDFMLGKMSDCAHDESHVYRVLFMSLDIASHEAGADTNILIASALLHDIARADQLKDLNLDHAELGAAKAYRFLTGMGWSEAASSHVRDCIYTHRFRRDRLPETIEAAILFDADKLDVTGTIGISRTLLYGGEIQEPLYIIEHDKLVTQGTGVESQSFIQEYNYKLKNIYSSFHTSRAREIAQERRTAAEAFYGSIIREISNTHIEGKKRLDMFLE